MQYRRLFSISFHGGKLCCASVISQPLFVLVFLRNWSFFIYFMKTREEGGEVQFLRWIHDWALFMAGEPETLKNYEIFIFSRDILKLTPAPNAARESFESLIFWPFWVSKISKNWVYVIFWNFGSPKVAKKSKFQKFIHNVFRYFPKDAPCQFIGF